MTSPRPRLVLTGASGFVARYVMRALKGRYRLVAIDRHPRMESQVPDGGEVEWHQADLADAGQAEAAFRRIAAQGGAEAVIHLAAHYDFTGEEEPEYWRANVDGLRYVLEGCRDLSLRRFIFASSVAACRFPSPGEVITEETPPDAPHIYARTKRVGEAMLGEYRESFPAVIVRFAALFSDWCEYPPLYHFLGTWLSDRWNATVLGGRGESAVPYLHVRDAALFLRSVLDHQEELEPEVVLLASPDGAVAHLQLFEAATREYFDGAGRRPCFVPRLLARPGMWLRDRLGKFLGERPFERPWMAEYIDRRLAVDASSTRERLGWAPRPRLEIIRRMPFLIENFRTDPVEWHRRNAQFMLLRQIRPDLRAYQALLDNRDRIVQRFEELLGAREVRDRTPHYQELTNGERRWNHRLILRNLIHAVRTRRKGLFMAYCRDLAERRAKMGFDVEEVIYALKMLQCACKEVLSETEEKESVSDELAEELGRVVDRTIRFGIDQVEMVFEALQGEALWTDEIPPVPTAPPMDELSEPEAEEVGDLVPR